MVLFVLYHTLYRDQIMINNIMVSALSQYKDCMIAWIPIIDYKVNTVGRPDN